MQEGGEGQLINHTLVRTRVSCIYTHCGLNAQVRIYPCKNVPVWDLAAMPLNPTCPGQEEALNVRTFSGCCLACKVSRRTTAQHKTGQVALERYTSRERDKHAKTRL